MALGSFRDLPHPLNFLNDAKVLLSPDKSKLRVFLRHVDLLMQHLSSNDTRCTHSLIYSIANFLRSAPRLLYGLNSIIRPRFRLECLTSIALVNHYVLVEGNNSWIYSFIVPNPQLPVVHVRNLIESRDGWDRMLATKRDDEWLACLAQILQEILDDPTTSVSFLSAARKRLIRLSNLGVIPPSIFVHLPAGMEPSDYVSNAEYVVSGGSSDVYKFDNGSSSVCFRVLRQREASHVEERQFRADFCKEVVVWRQLKHPNILDFVGVTVEIFPRRLCFVLPWLFHGSIMNYLRRHPEHDKFAFVGQIIDGVAHLHNLNPPLSHKDIKGANVLVRDDLVCVLTDFGLSNILDSQRYGHSDGKGTLYWMPPEMFGSDPLSADARPRDIYSLGCTICEIYTGKPPSAIMDAVLKGNKPTLPPDNRSWTEEDIELWGYVEMCLNPNPEDRPDIKLLRDALWVIRNWATSPFSSVNPEPKTITPADFTSLQECLKRELDLIRKPDLHYEVAQAVPLRQKPATLRACGLCTPNTPNYRWPPDLGSFEASVPISATLTHLSATTPKLQ